MAMRVHTSTPVSKRNPHVAKSKLKQKLLPTLLGASEWNGKYIFSSVVSKPLVFDNVVDLEQNAVLSNEAVPTTSDGHVQEDDSVAFEAWLEAFSLPQYSSNEIIAPARKEARIRKNGKIKLVDVNKVMACWLLPGDTWGKGGRPDPEYPTRTEYKRREGLSQYTRRRDGHSLRKVVDNGPWYKGPHWTASMSKFEQPLGFEKWSRPPTVADVLATHWACLASHSDYDYEEVHIQTRKKVEGKKYHEWPLGECTVINWKIRNASWWGPTLEESTFGGTQDMLVPVHTKGPVVLAPTEVPEQAQAANDPVVEDQVVTTEHVNDQPMNFTYYATKYPTGESLAYSNMRERVSLVQNQILNSKVSRRGIDTSLDKWHYNRWLSERHSHRTPTAHEYALKRSLSEYKMARFFPGMQATNRMAGLRKSFMLKNAYKVLDGVKKLYSKYTPDVTYSLPAYTASPPVYRVFPRLTHEDDNVRYEFWWRAIKATEDTPKDFLFRSDPVNSVTRIPAKVVEILCRPTLPITVGEYRGPFILPFIPGTVQTEPSVPVAAEKPVAKVTYSQQVLLNETKVRSSNRLSRDYEWIELPLVPMVAVQTSKPVIKKEFKEQVLDLAQLDEKLETALPADIRDFLHDSAFDKTALASMKGLDALSAKIAKQNDLLLGGFKLDESSGLMLPMNRKLISPQEMHSMLHGEKEFGRKRGKISKLVHELDNFLFGNPVD